MNHQKQRFWELDLLRGLAVVLMVFYHLVFDAVYFLGFPVNFSHWFWLLLAKYIQLSFLLLVGVSLVISYQRLRKESLTLQQEWVYFLKRGAKIFGAGLIVTLFSLIFVPNAPIILGVLHFIGLSVAIAYPWLKTNKNWWPLIILIITIGILLRDVRIDGYEGLVIGLMPKTFSSLDYFPLFPWFGVVLAGIEIGKKVYRHGQRSFSIINEPQNVFVNALSWIGQRALLIYLIHQPVIWFTLYLIGS